MKSRPIAWLQNTARNRLRTGMLGRAMGWGYMPSPRRLRIVAATRVDQKTFWSSTALGRSLAPWRHDHRLIIDVAFNNAAGLPSIYNGAIDRAASDEALMLVHDDVWLKDSRWLDKLMLSLTRFDVVGLAGNRRRVRGQQFWLTADPVREINSSDVPYVSGAVFHGVDPQHAVLTVFGPAPVRCELLDGLLLALRADLAQRWNVRFDERFMFHFYDMDFCRTARAAGWSLGTWPIDVVHQSDGKFTPAWYDALRVYQAKWRN